MEPGKTSFFQALGVPTKIARGTIEITTDLKLVEAGAKVGASEATLLNMLNISPFTYGMKVTQVYEDGQAFSPDVLDIEESQLLKALTSAIATITTISLATNYPTLPSVLHSLINGYKQVLAVAVETDYSWEGIEELKDRIANPDAYAAAAPAAAASTEDAPAAAVAAEEEKEEEKEESEDEGTPYMHPVQCLLTELSQVSAVFSTRRSIINLLDNFLHLQTRRDSLSARRRPNEKMMIIHKTSPLSQLFAASFLIRSNAADPQKGERSSHNPVWR